MDKIKLIKSINIDSDNCTYLDVLQDVLKTIKDTEDRLSKDGVIDKFEVIVDVIDNGKSVSLSSYKSNEDDGEFQKKLLDRKSIIIDYLNYIDGKISVMKKNLEM